MKRIAVEDIEAVMERMGRASEPEIQRIAERMQTEQPYIMVYLLASEEQLTEDEEDGWLMSLGSVIFESMSGVNPKLRPVSGDELLAAEEKNLKLLERLEEGSEMGFMDAVESLSDTYNQMPLLGMILNALMADYADEPELAPENLGLALLHLKTVIDCLDQ